MATLKERIYNFGIDIIGFLGKVGVILTLPFKFIRVWCEEWKKLSKRKEFQNKIDRDKE